MEILHYICSNFILLAKKETVAFDIFSLSSSCELETAHACNPILSRWKWTMVWTSEGGNLYLWMTIWSTATLLIKTPHLCLSKKKYLFQSTTFLVLSVKVVLALTLFILTEKEVLLCQHCWELPAGSLQLNTGGGYNQIQFLLWETLVDRVRV